MSVRHFLDYYRGRFTYTEVRNLPMRDYQTLTYIMYKENIEREKREAEEAAKRADEDEKREYNEKQNNRPMTLAEVRKNQKEKSSKSKHQSPPANIPKGLSNISLSELSEIIEDEL